MTRAQLMVAPDDAAASFRQNIGADVQTAERAHCRRCGFYIPAEREALRLSFSRSSYFHPPECPLGLSDRTLASPPGISRPRERYRSREMACS